GLGELGISRRGALQHQPGCFGDILDLLQKQGEEFFFAGQQFHSSSWWRSSVSGRNYISNSAACYCYNSVTIGKAPRSAATKLASVSRYRVSSSRPGFRFPMAESMFCFRSGYSSSSSRKMSRKDRRTVPVFCEQPQGIRGAPSEPANAVVISS